MKEINYILNNPRASQWLKDAIKAALERNPHEAAYEAVLLAHALFSRLGQMENPND